jgi:hypothetical protein
MAYRVVVIDGVKDDDDVDDDGSNMLVAGIRDFAFLY